MKKERYELAEIELIRFSTTDVLTGSKEDDDETPMGGLIKLPFIG